MKSAQNTNSEVDVAMPVEPAKAAQYLLYAIVGLFVFALGWAATAKLDRVTRGQGRVVTSNQLQELQYLEGGIVKEILVSAGDAVKAGDILVRLDPTQMNVEFSQGRESYNLLAARIERLSAESEMRDLSFPQALRAAAPVVIANERALYKARRAELIAAQDVEKSKLAQRRQSLEDAKVALSTAKEGLLLAREEHSMMKSLVAKGIEPQVELLRARQRAAAAKGDVQRNEIAISRSALEVSEIEYEIQRVEKTFTASATDELTQAKAELAALIGELPALEDKVARTDVRSPVDGVVNRVLVATIGGVVAPGETIAEVVPIADALVIEAKIKQADIGFLVVGQDAIVKISAYDASIYGSLEGVITNISPDAIQDEETGEWLYAVQVQTKDDSLQSRGANLKILPGMAADVEILNGKRTVLAYILKPIADVGDKALRDK